MGMDAKVIIADLQLLCAASLYGFGFAAQRAAMIEGMGPLTFNACRYIVSMVSNTHMSVFIEFNCITFIFNLFANRLINLI